ncbi:MAG: hypothetical protein PGMFKBFP_03108 [Anaerolineales bacterium]|nr:hypothetical protein [Anaerolineales bacterium]MCC6326756.1 hypothetical protein [Candidatus Brocadia sp.]
MKSKNLPGGQVVCYPCPLTSNLPKNLPNTLARRCVKIIESARHIWGYLSPEAIKKAVGDARRYARPSIEKDTTDQKILAIFAICEAFEAMREKLKETIKEKVLTASIFLKFAKTGLEPEKQDIPQINHENDYLLDNTNYLPSAATPQPKL